MIQLMSLQMFEPCEPLAAVFDITQEDFGRTPFGPGSRRRSSTGRGSSTGGGGRGGRGEGAGMGTDRGRAGTHCLLCLVVTFMDSDVNNNADLKSAIQSK